MCHSKREEFIVRVRKETHAGDQNSPHVVPTEGSLVDLSECKTTTLVGVLDTVASNCQLSRKHQNEGFRGNWGHSGWTDWRKSLWKLW